MMEILSYGKSWGKHFLLAGAVALASLIGANGALAEIIIDDFSQFQNQTVDFGGANPVTTTDITGTGYLGGDRTITTTLTSSGSCVFGPCLSTTIDGGSISQFSQAIVPGAKGYTDIFYGNKAAGGTDLNLDLSGQKRFQIGVLSSDLGGEITIQLTDGSGHTATGTFPTLSAQLFVDFNTFTVETLSIAGMTLSNPAFDFSDIDG